MADHVETTYDSADGNDYPAHEATYQGFTHILKYGTISVIVVVSLMAFFLV